VPFLRRKEEVAAVFGALPRSVNIVYALSALAGLRPREALALEWDAVHFEAGTIHVRRQLRHRSLGIPKSGKDRVVPIVPSLASVLKAWRKKNPKAELVAPSLRQSANGKTKFLNWRTIKNAMKKALKKAGVKPMGFYQAGRHTFACQWVLSGNSIYRLKEIMEHSTVQVTERYRPPDEPAHGRRARARRRQAGELRLCHPRTKASEMNFSSSNSSACCVPNPRWRALGRRRANGRRLGR
jgi:integrase